MKLVTNIVTAIVLLFPAVYAGTPVIDGVFDGEAVWGTPVAVADGVAGWQGVNIDKIYVTWDENYAYFAGLFYEGGTPAPWMRAVFDFNIKADGGPHDPWGEAVIYAYEPADQKPDFVIVGRLGDDSNWAEIRSWDGYDWDAGSGINLFPAEMAWTVDLNCIEARISKDSLGGADVCDVQFYVSGNNYSEHGTFDACPDDSVTPDWVTPTTLDNYAENVPIGIPNAVEPQNGLVRGFALQQNYPNPFNPTTTISYRLAAYSHVWLTIYDASGKKIKTLVNAAQGQGEYQLTFDGNTLASGVYFYQLTTDRGFSQIKKMILLR